MTYSPIMTYLCQKCWHEVKVRYGFNTCPICKAEGYMTGSYTSDQIKTPIMTQPPLTPAMEAMEELDGIIFSDGPGPVCGWVNKNQNMIRTALAQLERVQRGEIYDVGLTAIQRRGYDFICKGIQAGACPSYDQIKAHMGLRSKSGVSRLVDILVRRGLLEKTPNIGAQALRLVDRDRDVLLVKLKSAEMFLKTIDGRLARLEGLLVGGSSKDEVLVDAVLLREFTQSAVLQIGA